MQQPLLDNKLVHIVFFIQSWEKLIRQRKSVKVKANKKNVLCWQCDSLKIYFKKIKKKNTRKRHFLQIRFDFFF